MANLKFNKEDMEKPFQDYNEFMNYLFGCVTIQLSIYVENMMKVYATGRGDFKNVLYPDIEIVFDRCEQEKKKFYYGEKYEEKDQDITENEDADAENAPEIGDELLDILADFSSDGEEYTPEESKMEQDFVSIYTMMEYVRERASHTDLSRNTMPLYELSRKLGLSDFSFFAFVCAIMASTQTSYADVFQVVNQNGNLSMPTIESAARLYFGENFSVTGAYGEMSVCLEQLSPILDLNVNKNMPFATVISPDKRVIDYLFGKNPFRLDENYVRFFKKLTDDEELNPVMANQSQLDALEISYGDGIRIFSLYGDEGSGRNFFAKNFCRNHGMQAISINCKKLFDYDFSFVEKALWAVGRECILLNACCCLEDLEYREDQKEKFFGYLDLALTKLIQQKTIIFALSRELIPFKEATREDFTQLELPAPSNQERENVWTYFAKNYSLAEEISLPEMATKFLFTPGKIKSALHLSKSLASMNKEILTSRATLFKACNAQMSSELTKKATRVEAKFSFDDIVMNATQRETLQHAIDQMTYRKQVYDNWNYTKKYPYGRGLSVLLFGAPGTGKSMCAQVIAHELNLELYRVDLSKVIDKYVGETEKSISMIFREAKKCNVVLFFDECDTLFAKRSDDGGSNQSSNNNKTALLLQEVEAYDGVSVLATNYKHNIDPAFFRRMKYIVEFQFPDPDTRLMLWETTIPKTTPLAEDVDLRFIADKFEFVGGNIKNCILNAAFLAAADPKADGEVGMKHYLQAIRYEFVKTGKVFTRADFEPYASLVGL
ncbi:MAG: ATP-binding protein [Lachnospiraceae bacterium]|nr:ATP-binding protein [Lachnospiraceae bacterium]